MTDPTPIRQISTSRHLGEAGAMQRYRDERDALRNRLATARRQIAELTTEVCQLRGDEEKNREDGPMTDMTPQLALAELQRTALMQPPPSVAVEAVEIVANVIEAAIAVSDQLREFGHMYESDDAADALQLALGVLRPEDMAR